jgi:hypothetical protein
VEMLIEVLAGPHLMKKRKKQQQKRSAIVLAGRFFRVEKLGHFQSSV